MIIGVGNDIVAISKIAEVYFKFEEKFLQRIYSKHEVDAAKSLLKNNNQIRMINFLAKRFCAKEAFSKALGLGLGRGINFSDISIENNNLGQPLIKILPQKEQFLKKYLACQNYSIHLSLSDSEDLAFAVVIIEKIN
ncbi:holo-[acyl-carrier-protein] synthase [Alphaproteobacteria bacterium]|nr:holo-[acyl-carrier-protein] synthase [Alphaproteobacteria bacterium]